jgi:hypothetical protein
MMWDVAVAVAVEVALFILSRRSQKNEADPTQNC